MSAPRGSANEGAAARRIASSPGLEHALAVREAPIEESSGALGRSPTGAAAMRGLGMLAEVVLPADARAPGAARLVIAHCLTGLIARSRVEDARLLGSELACNSLQHGGLRESESLLVRVYLGADALRVEIENPGTFGAVAMRPPNGRSGGGFGLQLVGLLAARWGVRRAHDTTVWFEMGRA